MKLTSAQIEENGLRIWCTAEDLDLKPSCSLCGKNAGKEDANLGFGFTPEQLIWVCNWCGPAISRTIAIFQMDILEKKEVESMESFEEYNAKRKGDPL